MMSALEAALAYARRGWPVFPCRADKTPCTDHGVLDATTDPARLREWWERWPGANVAVDAGGAGLLVLDYDPGAKDEEVLASLGSREPLKTGLVSRTPRGGRHEFYRLPPGSGPVACSASLVAPSVDVRSFHGYVLLPPSRTAHGVYEWALEGEPLEAPPELLAACRRTREKDPLRDEWLIEPDLPEHAAKAVEWLRKEARLATEGQGGDNTTYATAAMMKSFGLSEARATELLWEHWNPRCEPPWEWEELALKVGNAYRYNTSPPGNLTPAYHAARAAQAFKPVVTDLGEGWQVEVGRFRFVDRRGIEEIKPPAWLLPEFLLEGSYGFIVGPRSSFKTFVALDAALTVATGGRMPWEEGEWRGVFDAPDKPGPVLYAIGEGRSGFRQRLRAWERLHLGEGRVVEDLVLADPVPRVADGADFLRQFIEGALQKRKDGYRLVVLDTMGRAMQGVNENQQENASAFTALAEHLQRELGAAVLVLHHTGHEAGERARGSSVFEADCDMVVVTQRSEDRVKLTMTKQRDAPEWESPRWAKIQAVKLSLTEDGVAAMRVEDKEPTFDQGANRARGDAERQHLAFEVVARRALEVLRAHPMKEMTNAEFSRLMASWRPEGKETLGVTDQNIRKTWLPRLRAERCEVRGYYDPGKDRWRYQP